MRRLTCASCVIASLLVLVPGGAQGRAQAAATVGVSVHGLDTATVSRYADVGFQVVRADLPYTWIVHHDGEHWEPYDAFVAELLRHRITPLLILQWDQEPSLSDPSAVAEFARFAGVAAQRYPHAILEILNEPNLRGEAWPYVDPDDYSRVVAAIRASAPTARLIGPALSGGSFDRAWLFRAIQAGLLRHLDAVSVHPYAVAVPEEAPAYYDELRGLMGRSELPIVVSEWGFLANDETQASLIQRTLRVNADYGIGLTVLYRWSDAPGHEFGLVREDGTDKPSAWAVRRFLRPDGGRELIR